jgi:transitional endoplasmic reticulum ATPase
MQREPVLPSWTEELKLRYLAGEASMFLLHGNVRDVHAWTDPDGTTRYVPMRELLERFLGRTKDIVVYYNVSEGFEFPDKSHRGRFMTAVNARRVLQGKPELDDLPRSANEVIPVLEDLITDPSQRAAVVLDFVETIVPMGELGFMGEADKQNMVALQRWASDPALLQSDNLVILVTENLSDVHRRVTASAQLAQVSVPLPGLPERSAFVRLQDRSSVQMEIDEEQLAKVTAGLNLVQIRGFFRRARQSKEPISFRTVSLRKKSIIEQECHGLVQFVDPEYNFSHVGGLEGLKQDLGRVATAIKSGQTHRVPMGILFVGPMGTGKTYVAEAFAAESGLTCIKFKNFREKWVGSTEGNLDKIIQVVDGLGYVLLIIDEADRSLSSSGDSDGGTNSRVIARLKEFFSDTSHRGRVVLLMMTNRPDKIDTDLKRPGRLDIKVPFFFPETPAERKDVLAAVARKSKFQLAANANLDHAARDTVGYSAAELEAVMIAAANAAADHNRNEIGAEDLAAAVRDVIPSRDTRMLEFMELLAVFESSSRRMLPERFRELTADQVQIRLDDIRLALGHRVL